MGCVLQKHQAKRKVLQFRADRKVVFLLSALINDGSALQTTSRPAHLCLLFNPHVIPTANQQQAATCEPPDRGGHREGRLMIGRAR